VPWVTQLANNDQTWISVVYGPNNTQTIFQTNSTFSYGAFEVDVKAATLTPDQQQLLVGLNQQQQIIFISQVGQAIAAALSKWPLNLKTASVELKTVVINGNTGFVNVIDTLSNSTYSVQYSQVQYSAAGQPLYYVQISYPTGAKAGYLVAVAQAPQGLF